MFPTDFLRRKSVGNLTFIAVHDYPLPSSNLSLPVLIFTKLLAFDRQVDIPRLIYL